jgi:deoxyribodipyrimidine photolyase-related protein
MVKPIRHLVLVLGDQLDEASAAFDGFDPRRDAVWLAEVSGEARYVWSHQARIALFLSSMRHFRDQLRARGWRVFYRQLDDPSNAGSLAGELARSLRELQPQRVVVVEPGEWRVAQDLHAAVQKQGTELEIRADRHFLCTPAEFRQYASDRRQLRLEFFYRYLRRRTGILMDGDQPLGGQWNFDRDNRKSFPKGGPGFVPEPRRFPPDDITQEVLRLVARQFADHPGRLDRFDWPVTSAQARQALADFIDHRLSHFGPYQDAMWAGQPWLFHSRLSSALNLKLLNPREVISAALAAYPDRASLASVEGFVRQILGWREYVRGVYWLDMPHYLERNALGATLPLPRFYWTAQTDMNCLQQVISQTLELGFAHHIQRLMVTGLFALLLGVDPKKVHEWYLAVYVDAVEWVELPNTLGMSQYADGGMMASKPYIATGQYIRRMSNYCAGCRYRPEKRTGPDACPFTTLYWDFLDRHQELLRSNQRMTMQLRNLERVPRRELPVIRRQADQVRSKCLA